MTYVTYVGSLMSDQAMLTPLQAINVYSKAIPETTYDQLERAFRTNGFNTHLIAFVRGQQQIQRRKKLTIEIGEGRTPGHAYSDQYARRT